MCSLLKSFARCLEPDFLGMPQVFHAVVLMASFTSPKGWHVVLGLQSLKLAPRVWREKADTTGNLEPKHEICFDRRKALFLGWWWVVRKERSLGYTWPLHDFSRWLSLGGAISLIQVSGLHPIS